MLSTQEPKGTKDWFPEEFKLRQYIFSTWRQVCLAYGYEEYLSPLLESAAIYQAKSGEDVGGPELLTFKDLGGRELSIRPEMTPSLTRMVAKIYSTTPKPIRYFSIANFIRNEKPQRGRNREFWQLNCDIFGIDALSAEQEMITMAIDIMLAFGAKQENFKLRLNNRILINDLLNSISGGKIKASQQVEVLRIMDKWAKLDIGAIKERLAKLSFKQAEVEQLELFMEAKSLSDLTAKLPQLKNSLGLSQLEELLTNLKALAYDQYVEFAPSIIRGFDYYDGLVFEVFDLHPDNKRALFGGGRYNGLAEIFGEKNFPAIGFAPGDETMALFLKSWNLVEPEKIDNNKPVYLPLLASSLMIEVNKLAKKLRQEGLNVLLGLEEQKLNKALDYANKRGLERVIIVGEDEHKQGIYKEKDMLSGKEIEKKL